MGVRLRVKKLVPEAQVPTRGTDRSNGYDFYSVEDVTLLPGQRYAVKTGLQIELPDGWTGLVCPRSGRAIKEGLTVLNSPGIVDSDYRGEVRGILINEGDDPVYIKKGERIIQLVIVEALHVEEWIAVDELSETQRGEGGLGHTGK